MKSGCVQILHSKNKMDAFRMVMLQLMPEHCFDEFFLNYNFLHAQCLKLTLSKCLGLGIIAGSVLVKIPQIVKILGASSAAGISLIGILLELSALTSAGAYSYASGFPFSAWGETLFLIIQTATITFLVIKYGLGVTMSFAFTIAYLVLSYLLISGFFPMSVLWALQASVIPIVIVAKLIQAWVNYTNGGTGQLSAATVFLLFAGSVARIFTSIQETGDPLIVATYVVTTICNGIIVAQMLYYWGFRAAVLFCLRSATSSSSSSSSADENPRTKKKKVT